MTSKQEPWLSPISPKGLQRVKHQLKQRGRATIRGLKGKTFRDWVQVPIIVALLGLVGSIIAITVSGMQHQSDQRIAKDQQQQTVLQTYFDRMSDLILNDHLKTTKTDEIRYIARTRTLDALLQLDSKGISGNQRKGEIVRFFERYRPY